MLWLALLGGLAVTHPNGDTAITLRTRTFAWTLAANGTTASFVDLRAKRDYGAGKTQPAFLLRVGAKMLLPASVVQTGDRLRVTFQEPGCAATLRVRAMGEALVLDVLSVEGDAEELTFGLVPLTLRGSPEEPFAACVLARNLRTNVPELPGACSILRAHAYRRLGMEGASAAIVAAPAGAFRKALQRAVEAAPELAKSPIGGPYALDAPLNRSSYLFNFGGLNVDTAPRWIALAKALGARQVDFHGGQSFRFGDFEPDPETYPRGLPDLKAVVDALHAAGLQAGLHTYSFFIDKRSRYVTPVPDPRLASFRTFTLAEPLDERSDVITVQEPTTGMTAVTGFFVANSATLRIGEELITFREATQEPPYRFLGCTRGAYGTRASAHAVGEKAHHLKELFGLFMPDAETDLFTEIVENTARVYNECGFDMIYLDALDGSYMHAGSEWAWYYGARFVHELVRRLKKPPILEMSTFHHHLWCVRARMGAWDAASRGYKEFVDMHRVVNQDCRRMFLPSHLGWWAVWGWNGIHPERTLPDDLEYLLCKSVADDAGLSFVVGFSADTFDRSAGAQRYADIISRYEEIRRAGVPPAIRKALGEPGREFTLQDGPRGKRAFVPVRYRRTDVAGTRGVAMVENGEKDQPLAVRIEARLGVVGPADREPLLEGGHASALSAPRCAEGVSLAVGAPEAGAMQGAPGDLDASSCLLLSAASSRKERPGSWAMVERVFPAPVNLGGMGLGVWIRGDGSGTVLNFQLRNAPSVSPGVAERYVVVDFEGWRYFELVEQESDRLSAYEWPYASSRSTWEKDPGRAFQTAYTTYHPSLRYDLVHSLAVWVNNVPPGGEAHIVISPVRALSLGAVRLKNPRVQVGGVSVTLPVELQTGWYAELDRFGIVSVYGPNNELVERTSPQGSLPMLRAGANEVLYECEAMGEIPPRVRLTVMEYGKPLRF